MDANTTEAVNELTLFTTEIDLLMAGRPFDAAHTRWLQNTRFCLNRWFGAQSTVTRNFAALTFQLPSGAIVEGPSLAIAIDEQLGVSYRQQLETAKGILLSALDQLDRYGLDEMRAATGLVAAGTTKDVFITHGGTPPILPKVERIVRVLGFNPIVVEVEPSSGGAVDDLVPAQMRKCICGIVIATRDQENPESKYPRPNVLHEIGLAQEIFKTKVIYLKEEGLEFPSNVVPKVWEPFTNDNPEPVWDKIVREFRGFGFIP